MSKAEQERRKGAPSRGRGTDGVRQKLVGIVLPLHAKVVTALMRAIDAREKDSIVAHAPTPLLRTPDRRTMDRTAFHKGSPQTRPFALDRGRDL